MLSTQLIAAVTLAEIPTLLQTINPLWLVAAVVLVFVFKV